VDFWRINIAGSAFRAELRAFINSHAALCARPLIRHNRDGMFEIIDSRDAGGSGPESESDCASLGLAIACLAEEMFVPVAEVSGLELLFAGHAFKAEFVKILADCLDSLGEKHRLSARWALAHDWI